MLDNFVDVIQGKSQPIVSGESVLGTIELLEQAYIQATRYRMPWNDHLQSWNVQTKVRTDDSTGPKRVLVTGVSGFVGGRVVEAMALTDLFRPVAAVRNWARAARSAVHPVSLVQCDIMDLRDVHAAVKGVDAIVHCAYTDERNGIVGATKNLLEAAKAHGVSDFLYLSSAEVYGNNREGKVTEEEVLSPMGRDYGDAKLEAETLCREYASHGVFATILRPSLIYGPHGESWSIKIGKKLQSGKWGMFEGFGEGYANLVYVDDLVKAIVLSLQQPSSECRVYNVNGFEPPTWNQYFQQFNRALGLPELVAISPSKSKWKTAATDVVRSITSRIKTRFYDQLMEIYMRGGMASQLMKRLKGRLDSTPSGGELTDLYARKAIYVDDKIRKELGYSPDVSLEQGLRMTIQWMLHHELIADPKRIQAFRSFDEDPKELVLS
jgi:nucleoside-diphosphate-sugar epimerase